MNPIEAMARARWHSANFNRDYWALLPQEAKECQISDMRAALIALRDCEFPERDDEWQFWYDSPPCPQDALRRLINAILEEG